MATNSELIQEALIFSDFEYNGENLKTFNEWQKAGYTVKKGEKAFLSVDLWKPVVKKVIDKETGKPVIDEETGKEKEETHFIKKLCHLFHEGQVKEGVIERTPRAKKKTTKKRTYKKKTA